MDIACSTNCERNACRILVRKPEGKRSLGRQRRRWVFNIKMNVRDVEWSDTHWIYLTQEKDRWTTLVNTVMNLRVP
jgi:hypothetical protein